MFPLKDTVPSSSFPFVTIGIIVINFVVFFYELTLGPQLNTFINQYGVIPSHILISLNKNWFNFIPASVPVFSSIFIHGGWMHIIGNMWYLWIFGDNIEDRTGHFRFFLFYVICGVAATVSHVIMNPASNLPTVGASGAIAGVMGAYLILFPRSRILTLIFLIIFIQIIEIPAIFFLGFWILLQVVSGSISFGLTQESGGVGWWAHIGGFFVGLVMVFFFRKRKRIFA
jgi:membrane associated rhomboid family serine protease